MNREEAIHNISVVTDEQEDIVERRANAVYKIHALPIINVYGNGSHLLTEKPTRKSNTSPYAKFDKYHKKKRK